MTHFSPSSSCQTLRFFRSLPAFFLVAAFFTFSSCRQQVELVSPAEDDLIVLNGCVISACNYLAVVKTQHKLEPNFWAKVLLVRFADHPAGHAYCVWETEGTIYGYDRNAGGFPIPVYTRDARAIAIVLAEGLSKIMKENLSVQSAEFVEPTDTKLYRYSQAAPAAPKEIIGLASIDNQRLTVVGAPN